MKKIITTALVLSGMVAYAQQGNVGINENTPKATLHLEVASVNKNNGANQGLLLPRVSKQFLAGITSPEISTLIYVNEITAGVTGNTVTEVDAEGFYYFYNGKWRKVTSDIAPYTAGQAIDITSSKISVKSPVNTQTGAYTLAATDDNGYVYINSATAVNVTVPDTLSAGFSCVLVQQGDGQVTIVGSGGVSLQTARGTKTRTKYSAIGIIKRTTTEATITGDATN